MSFLNDSTISLLQRGLNAQLARQNQLTSNVANLDTPGYVPKDVDFQQALAHTQSAGKLKRTNQGHQALDADAEVGIRNVESPDRAPSANGNQVDLDTQMARIAQNAISYQANIKAVSKKLAILKYTVSEGGI